MIARTALLALVLFTQSSIGHPTMADTKTPSVYMDQKTAAEIGKAQLGDWISDIRTHIHVDRVSSVVWAKQNWPWILSLVACFGLGFLVSLL